MAFLADAALDNGLSWIASTTQVLYITSSLCSTYAQVTSNNVGIAAYSSGVAAAGAGSPNGRQVACSSVPSGSVTSTATASSYAIVNTSGPFFVASGDLSAAQSVTSGNTFTLTSFTIRYPAP